MYWKKLEFRSVERYECFVVVLIEEKSLVLFVFHVVEKTFSIKKNKKETLNVLGDLRQLVIIRSLTIELSTGKLIQYS